MSKNIIIFDLDGTLVDSGENIAKAINYTRERLGLSVVASEFVLNHINKDDINAAKVFYGTNCFTKEQREHFEPYYDSICHMDIVLYERVGEFLERFKSLDFKMGVATNGKSTFAKKMLSHLKVDSYFDFIYGADSVAYPKPNPQMLLKILDGYGFEEDSKALMVGDSIKDIKAAKAIGITSAVAEWGFGDDKPVGDKNLTDTNELDWIIDFFKD